MEFRFMRRAANRRPLARFIRSKWGFFAMAATAKEKPVGARNASPYESGAHRKVRATEVAVREDYWLTNTLAGFLSSTGSA